MLELFKQYITEYKLCNKEDNILLGISGGADSVAMLDLFAQTDLKIAIAHCNFLLRDKESDEDENFVSQLAKIYNVPLFVTEFDTKAYANNHGISIEMAARDLRYEWFEQLLTKHNYSKLAVAHNKNDSIETFFLNISRGTGIRGITGINTKNKNIIRPLLFADRKAIELYLQSKSLPYRHDSSNDSLIHLRNKVRHAIIPQFIDMNSDFINTMSDNISKFKDVFSVYEKEIKRQQQSIVKKENNKTVLSIEKLQQLSPIKPYIFEFLHEFGVNETQIDDISSGLHKQAGKTFYTPTHRILIDRTDIIIEPHSPLNNKVFYINKEDFNIQLPLPLQFRIEKGNTIHKRSETCGIFDLSKIKFPLELRTWQKGDYLAPLGMKGKKKKVSDILTDYKLNLFEKERVYVLLSNNEIIWLVGYRTSENFKITNTTKEHLIIQY